MNIWERQAQAAGVLVISKPPGRAVALAREAEHHRRQAEQAAARGDASEADLWTALADEIDSYLAPADAAPEPALFDPD